MASSSQVDDLRNEIIQNLRSMSIREYDSRQLEKAEAIGPGGYGGSGARADVYGKKLANGELVAVKCLSKSLEREVANAGEEQPDAQTKRERLLKHFERECGLWYMSSKESGDARSSKIVRLLGFARSYEGSIFPSLVLELHRKGDLRSLVEENKHISEKERLQLLRDVASGLAFLHKPDLMIVHRDIKGKNILVREQSDGTLSAAIGDFGSAKNLDPRVFPILNSSFSESLHWTPPEYIVNGSEDYSNPTIFGDVWSFACTLIEIMSNSDPWKGRNNIVRYLSGELLPQHPPRPKCFKRDSRYWNLALKCFLPPPEGRPTGRLLETDLQDIYDNL